VQGILRSVVSFLVGKGKSWYDFKGMFMNVERRNAVTKLWHLKKMLEAGIRGKQEIVVTEDKTARRYGSGTLDVFATPAMIALMENTAYKSVEEALEEGAGTVGTEMNVKHVAATPVGMKVTCETELVKVEGRALTFLVKAYDECGLIGEGVHQRFVIMEEKFQTKTNGKLENA